MGHRRGGHYGGGLLASYLAGCTTVSWGTDTGPSLWVAPLSRTTLTYLGAVDTKHSWWAAFQAVRSSPAWGAGTAPVLGVAGPSMMTLAGLGAFESPVAWGTRFRAVRACPSCQTIAGPVRRVAGRVVVALAGHAAFAVATRLAGPLAGRASEPRRAHTVAVLGYTGTPISAGASVAAVGPPKALGARQVAA